MKGRLEERREEKQGEEKLEKIDKKRQESLLISFIE